VKSNYNLSQEIIEEIEEKLNSINAEIIESIPSLRQTKEHIAAIAHTIGAPEPNLEPEPHSNPNPNPHSHTNSKSNINSHTNSNPNSNYNYNYNYHSNSHSHPYSNHNLHPNPHPNPNHNPNSGHAPDSNAEIELSAQKTTGPDKGTDVFMHDSDIDSDTDTDTASFSIGQHGYGTRSWISFLILSAFVETQGQKLKENDAEQFIMLAMEEPEVHLHPQAQRQLFDQISRFQGQKVISTHAPSIIAQSALTDVIYFKKQDGKTMAIRYKGGGNRSDENTIFREVINTRADLLFASAIVLCEGITEELALPVFFTEYFGCAPYSLGVSIVSMGGQKYKPYLSLIKDFGIPWFIFSDGEEYAKSAVKSAVKDVFGLNAKKMPNVVILDNGDDYENYLIREGYSDLIIEAICEHEEDEAFFEFYIDRLDGQKRKGGTIRNYTHESGRRDALSDLCHERKTEYALPVARKLVRKAEPHRKIPSKIKTLFSVLADKIGVVEQNRICVG
jgi:putative ATP-dependent endonuclease of OLD family